MLEQTPGKKDRKLLLLHPLHRILLSLLIAAIVYVLLQRAQLSSLVFYMLLWDAFACCYIALNWVVFFSRTPEQIRRVARFDDGSRTVVFLTVLVASFFSMFTVLLLMLEKEATGSLYLPVAIAGMLLSWAMVHTTFSIHYAHLYYEDNQEDHTRHAAGLDFPHEPRPDYLDFAYFSFVIGMTFQVSDVQIYSRKLRRTALVHALLAFLLNTFVVALTINLIAGLSK